MPLPLIKLASLLIKQLGKPMTNAVKRGAKSSPTFRNACITVAGWYHKYEVNVKMNLLGLGKSSKVRPLEPEAAVQLGAETIGEVFIYMFMASLLVIEYAWTATKKPAADPVVGLKESVETLRGQVTDMSLMAATTEAELRELQRKVGQLDSENSSLSEKLKALESDNRTLTEKVKASKSRWF